MENRFGVKDLIVSALLTLVIVVLILNMFEYDRQWQKVLDIEREQQTQAQYLSDIRRMLVNGTVATKPPEVSTSAPATTQFAEDEMGPKIGVGVDPFARMRKVEKLALFHRGDVLVESSGAPPDKLTPLISQDAFSGDVQGYVQESLAGRDPDTLEWYPILANWWRISKDGLKIEFEIRRGVTFSDGQPLNADDVVFTYNWIMNPDVETPRTRSYMDQISNVIKLDDYHVLFTYKQPYFKAFELAGTMGIMPKHFYSKFTPTQFNQSTGLLLGSGPYRLEDPESWRPDPGKPVVLVRNERYWGLGGGFDSYRWKIITNDAARYTTFLNGDLDIFAPTPEQYIGMVKDADLLKHTNHFEFDLPTSGYHFIGWAQKMDGKPTRFADRRVRLAMTLLTNRQRICKEIYLGFATPISGPFSRLSPQNDPKVELWPYDPKRALALLKEAGYEDRDGRGVLTDKDGVPFKFKLSYPAVNELTKRMVLFLKDDYAKAGVILEPDPLEWSVLLERMKSRSFEAITLAWSGDIESDLYQIFDSSQIVGIGDDFINYANPELDKLIEQARATVEEKPRMEIWHKAQRILHEDQPYTFISTGKDLIFLDKRIQNVYPVKIGLDPDTEWFVPAGRERWANEVP